MQSPYTTATTKKGVSPWQIFHKIVVGLDWNNDHVHVYPIAHDDGEWAIYCGDEKFKALLDWEKLGMDPIPVISEPWPASGPRPSRHLSRQEAKIGNKLLNIHSEKLMDMPAVSYVTPEWNDKLGKMVIEVGVAYNPKFQPFGVEAFPKEMSEGDDTVPIVVVFGVVEFH